MATRGEVEKVLEKVQRKLRDLGAHGLLNRPGKEFGVRGSVILAWVPPGHTGVLPTEVTANVDGKKISVPLRIEEQEMMRAE